MPARPCDQLGISYPGEVRKRGGTNRQLSPSRLLLRLGEEQVGGAVGELAAPGTACRVAQVAPSRTLAVPSVASLTRPPGR